jgi:anti-sigma factor RsiW
MFAGLLDNENTRAAPPDAEETVVPLRPAPSSPWRSPTWRLAAAASFALTVFGAGIVAGVVLAPKPPVEEVTQRNWMDAVAQYVSLFSAETLAGMPADQQTRLAGLQRASQALGKAISAETVAGLPSLDFKGTQLLQLDGRPIAQIAFQSETCRPVAICIIRTSRAPEPPSPERRQGLNIVHWIEGGYGYMVIGDLPADAIARISDAARQRLS